jgi:hypothetical protein
MKVRTGLLLLIGLAFAGCNHDNNGPSSTHDLTMGPPPCTLHSISPTVNGCTLLVDCPGTEMREVSCATQGQGYHCDCVINGNSVSNFDSADLCRLSFPTESLPAVNQACSWDLQ